MPMPSGNVTEDEDALLDAGLTAGHPNDADLDAEDRAKIVWLRNAAQKGIDQLDRGEYVVARSREEIDAIVRSAGSLRR